MDIRGEFERCWPWLQASLEFAAFRHGDNNIWVTHNKQHVFERIITKRCLFWPASDCAVITERYISPTGLVSHHNWLAGGNLEQIVALMPNIERYGRDVLGAHRQTGSGRRGWLRAFEGYQEIGVRKAKALI